MNHFEFFTRKFYDACKSGYPALAEEALEHLIQPLVTQDAEVTKRTSGTEAASDSPCTTHLSGAFGQRTARTPVAHRTVFLQPRNG